MLLQRAPLFNPNGIVNHFLDVEMAGLGWMERSSNDAPITRIPSTLNSDLSHQRLQRLSAIDPVADEENAPIALALQTGVTDVVRRVGRALLSHSQVSGVLGAQCLKLRC